MLAIQQQDRRGSGDGLHYLAWPGDVVLRGLPLEHLLDQRAIGDVDKLANDDVIGKEDGAVALAQRKPELERANHAKPGLKRARKARPGNFRDRLG
jgi:hypothetical protein